MPAHASAVLRPRLTRWLGVDVGGKRKGFDVALIDERRLVMLAARLDCADVLMLVRRERPALVAIDSSRSCAAPGETTRDGERELARRICGIRWTPDPEHVHGSDYYTWIVEGLALFGALAVEGVAAIEVFPTASWTRWLGARATRSRSDWSREGLVTLGLEGLPARTNQDARDAIAAAVTARLHTQGMTESIGEIVVPAP